MGLQKTKGAKGSLYQFQFFLNNRKRTTLRLGQMSQRAAEEIARHVDHLVMAAKFNTRISPETLAWLRSADRDLVAKLHAWGLAPKYVNPTVAQFTQEYIDSKKLGSAERTIIGLTHSRQNLIDFLGPDKLMDSVTPNDAIEFFDWMLRKGGSKRSKADGIGENTARGRFSKVRQMFNGALDRDIITRNPFKIQTHSASVGAAKKTYIPEATINSVIEHCTSPEWRLFLAFGRFVGCRMPSEIRELKWEDVNWERNTILLKSPKTASKGKPERLVPIFPSVYPLLLTQSESVPDGTVYVFPTLRNHKNAATTARKLVNAAGFTSWGKFWNSMRASRETDLMDSVGLRRACAWIGNTPKIAMQNYALLKSTDYLDAGIKSDADSDAATPRKTLQGATEDAENPIKSRVFDEQVAEAGVEPARRYNPPQDFKN